VSGWGAAITILVALAGGGGAAWFLLRPQIKKLRAEAEKIDVDTRLVAAAAEDAHLKTIVDYVVKPLREELHEVREKLTALESQVNTISRRYRMALEYVRQVLVWSRWHKDLDPPLPQAPPEILDEI